MSGFDEAAKETARALYPVEANLPSLAQAQRDAFESGARWARVHLIAPTPPEPSDAPDARSSTASAIPLPPADEARAIRIVAGISQERLAVLIGCSVNSLRRWERGETTPHPLMRPKYARALAELSGGSRD